MAYSDYPWFKDATLGAIYNLKLLHGSHLHWPDLDVDLELESLQQPEKYPLVYKQDRAVVADAPSARKIRKASK